MKTGIVLVVVVDGEEDAIIWELWKRDECPSAVAAAFILNTLRFGEVIKHMSTTSIFEHSARFYWIAETYLPQEKAPWRVSHDGDRCMETLLCFGGHLRFTFSFRVRRTWGLDYGYFRATQIPIFLSEGILEAWLHLIRKRD